jgi:CheY-like chemotaxis protein
MGTIPVSEEILVVEDDDLVRVVIDRTLRRAGYTVVLARDGAEALSALSSHLASLRGMVLDLTLPGMRGEEVLAHVRRVAPSLPVMLSSGWGACMVDRATLAASDGFLEKPFRGDELLDTLRRTLSQPKR